MRYRRGRSADSWCATPHVDQVGSMQRCEETLTQEMIQSKDRRPCDYLQSICSLALVFSSSRNSSAWSAAGSGGLCMWGEWSIVHKERGAHRVICGSTSLGLNEWARIEYCQDCSILIVPTRWMSTEVPTTVQKISQDIGLLADLSWIGGSL
jgi:hypothetical protein